MQPKEIADKISEKLDTVHNKKSFYGTLNNNLGIDFTLNLLRYRTLTYQEWENLKESVNSMIDNKLATLRKEALQELEKEQKEIAKKISAMKADMGQKE